MRYQLLVLTVGILFPAVVKAQQSDSIKADSAAQQQAYEGQRGALVKELQDTQDKLGDLRSQRVRLEARIENVLAETMQKRTQQLLVSKEETALLQLDGVLANAQDNMVAQRDRMRALGDAVRRRAGAVLVVTLRADSAAPGSLGDASSRSTTWSRRRARTRQRSPPRSRPAPSIRSTAPRFCRARTRWSSSSRSQGSS